ncbi:hypothetical protein H5P28_09015 [Ruficoccus amylovorans]|uniref:Uncharacterized protein n=1 Tax=Ruficoccus amylovorans TaxID=1804625 RepID=A0A842HD02_9BACT|nr:hypothetical protein [Ruficoccus amylovorans]MBC2594395.1 hypothetical protein [Ruficoccus amylovorans]
MKKPAMLPESEWTFDSAVAEWGLCLVFCYEYARTACTLYPEFAKLIEEVCYVGNVPSPIPWEGYKDYGIETPEEGEDLDARMMKRRDELAGHHLGPFLLAVLRYLKNPKLGENKPISIANPFVDWFVRYARNWSNRSPNPLYFMHPGRGNAHVWTSYMGEACDVENDTAWMAPSTYRPTDRPLKPLVHGFTTASLMEVNWAYPDKILMKYFEQFLRENRPPRYRYGRGPAALYTSKQIGVYGQPFPFDQNQGLEWLSVFRRRNAILDYAWDEYFALYDPIKGNENELSYLKRKEASQERLAVQMNKAEVILKWFAHGGYIAKRKSNSEPLWKHIKSLEELEPDGEWSSGLGWIQKPEFDFDDDE